MVAYIIADINVTNNEQYKSYQEKVPETVKKYGGRFIVRGGNPKVIEGDWDTQRLVVIEFDNPDLAKAWYESNDYQSIIAVRHRASRGKIALVEGV